MEGCLGADRAYDTGGSGVIIVRYAPIQDDVWVQELTDTLDESIEVMA